MSDISWDKLEAISKELLILHNVYDKASRDFIEANPGVKVLDWYDDQAREAWIDSGGTIEVSAFPSVAYQRPEYIEPGRQDKVAAANGQSAEVTIPPTPIAGGVEVVRSPKSINEVVASQTEHFALAAVSLVEEAFMLNQEAAKNEIANAEIYVAQAEAADVSRAAEIRARLNSILTQGS